jgi:hypothetical protein
MEWRPSYRRRKALGHRPCSSAVSSCVRPCLEFIGFVVQHSWIDSNPTAPKQDVTLWPPRALGQESPCGHLTENVRHERKTSEIGRKLIATVRHYVHQPFVIQATLLFITTTGHSPQLWGLLRAEDHARSEISHRLHGRAKLFCVQWSRCSQCTWRFDTGNRQKRHNTSGTDMHSPPGTDMGP